MRIVQRKLGWKEVGDDEDWEIYWTDTSVTIERIIRLNKIQVTSANAVRGWGTGDAAWRVGGCLNLLHGGLTPQSPQKGLTIVV